MNSRQRGTLRKIFEQPTRSDVRWQDVTSLLRALGAGIEERSGSRVAIKLGQERGHVHRPHPRPEVGKATLEDIRALLTRAGFTPGDAE